MPDTKLARAVRDAKDPPADRALRAAVAAGMAETGLTGERLAARMKFSQDTLTRRLKQPEKLTLAELRKLRRICGWDEATVGRIVR